MPLGANRDPKGRATGTEGGYTIIGRGAGASGLRLQPDCLGSWLEYDHIVAHPQDMATTERVTVTLSGELLSEIDRVERNRSRFIAEAVQHELARRRRDALLQSVSNPHTETAQFIDAGLADWTSDLPEDEGLVDPAGGTAVRWIEGQGWVRESV